MKLRSLLIATVPFISIAAQVVTFDYRHETNDSGGNNHKDRLSMSHRFANGFGLSLEGKWKGGQNKDKAFDETVSNGTEVVASYVYKINSTFQVEPGFSLDSTHPLITIALIFVVRLIFPTMSVHHSVTVLISNVTTTI